MSGVAMMKPVRVIRELTLQELFIRAVERAGKMRDDARARADADYVERIEEARTQYLVTPAEQETAPAAAESA